MFVNGLSYGIGRHQNVQKFINKSQGASGTVAIASHLREFDLTGYHYLLIEYCINETALLSKGRERTEHTFRHIASLIDHAASFGCASILVNFPSIHNLGTTVPMMEMFEREFVARGVAVFDAQSLLEKYVEERGIDVEACFYDPLHLQRPIAYALGAMIVDTAERVRSEKLISAWVEEADVNFGSIGFVPAGELIAPGSRTVERSNSLFKVSSLVLADGQSVTLPDQHGRQLVLRGVAYNAARSIGTLVSSVGETVLEVKKNKLYGADRDLCLVNIPTTLSDRKINGGEVFTYKASSLASKLPAPVEFELSGFIVHYVDRYRPLRVVAFADGHRHLHKTLLPEDFKSLDEAWTKVARDGVKRSKHSYSSADTGLPF